MDQKRTPLFDAIKDFACRDVVPMFIPSHKMGRAIHPEWKEFAGENIFKMDLCEIHGLDDLHQPKDVIKESQELAADAWGADRSFFLVNGTSSGIIASICSVVSEGQQIIVPRNAHKSVVFGLIVSGAEPVYVSADIYKEKGLVGGFRPAELDRIYAQNPGAKGVFGVSPTYHGICSDMKGLIDVTHRGGGIFIADEAHGNHVYFHEDLPEGALRLGADLACQSIHKMSGSLTQSSLLHLKSGRIDLSRLKANLQLAQNTSPSYLLMASLDLARSFIATEGHALFDRLIPEIDAAREEMKKIPGIEVLDKGLAGTCGIFAYEPMRLVFSAREMGVEGYELYDVLRDAYGIEIEFGDYYYAICVLGLGTEKGDLDRLIRALKDLSSRRHGLRPPLAWDEELPGIPPMAMLPRRAHFAERERVSWADAKGRVSAEMVVPYPPGIPVLCPGEIVTDEVWDFLDYQNRNGRHLHGPESGKLTHLHVVRE